MKHSTSSEATHLERTAKEILPKTGLLKNQEFLFFMGARLFFTLGRQSVQVILSWQVLDLTKSPLALGFLGIIEFTPHFFLSFFGGYIADLYSRRTILLFCQSGAFLCSLSLLGLNIFGVPTNYPVLAIGCFYGIVATIGLITGFYAPAALSFMAHIVERELYPKSSAYNSAVWQISSVAGPAIGGFIYAQMGVLSAYVFSTLLFFIAFILMLATRTKAIPQRGEAIEHVFLSIARGFQFIYRQKALAGALFLDLFAVLFGGAVALLPIFADKILEVGPSGLGYLRAAPAFGALFISLFLIRRPILKNTGKILLLSVSAFGFCMIAFAFSRDFYLSLAFLFLSGAFDCVSVVIRSTMIQLLTPDHMRGKVGAINSIFISSSNEIGAFESGVTAHFWGVIPSVWIGGLLSQLVVLCIAIFSPDLRSLALDKLTKHSEISSTKKKKRK